MNVDYPVFFFHIAMEKGPFVDVLPLEHGEFP